MKTVKHFTALQDLPEKEVLELVEKANGYSLGEKNNINNK